MSYFKILYGFHAITARLRRDVTTIEKIIYNKTRRDNRMQDFLHIANKSGVCLIGSDDNQLYRLSRTVRHQGVVALVRDVLLAQNISELLDNIPDLALLLILDGVTDPHNLGACLRIADATGTHAVIAPRNRAVGLNSTAAKVASGAADTVPYITVTNLSRSIRELKDAGVWIIGTSYNAKMSLYELKFDRSVAIVMGSEGKGMRRLTHDKCDEIINIPMLGSIENLNVSVATGICLYEAVRQRIMKNSTDMI
ncbi:MAG: 23S rRNA (guanosine(2251)-2'-O)-methyltransferase RlmB [Burkholderia sp.]|nr:23S rRNA (guanosine(2251)-2'-O)-methyltransferase RlmB [Burkholderia sp.]